MTRPGKIVAVGRNYREHAKEMGNEVPAEPLIFLKPPSSVIGDGDAIVLTPLSARVEFEGEIGVVIGAAAAARVGVRGRGGDRLDRRGERRHGARSPEARCPVDPSQGLRHVLSNGDRRAAWPPAPRA